MDSHSNQKDKPTVYVMCKKNEITTEFHYYDLSSGKDVTDETVWGPTAPIRYKIAINYYQNEKK